MTLRLRQCRIEGTYDPVPPEVEEAALAWLDMEHGVKRLKEGEKQAKEALIEAMRDYDTPEVEVEGRRVTLSFEEKPKLTVEKLPEQEDDDAQE